jgi:hypothetical protein
MHIDKGITWLIPIDVVSELYDFVAVRISQDWMNFMFEHDALLIARLVTCPSLGGGGVVRYISDDNPAQRPTERAEGHRYQSEANLGEKWLQICVAQENEGQRTCQREQDRHSGIAGKFRVAVGACKVSLAAHFSERWFGRRLPARWTCLFPVFHRARQLRGRPPRYCGRPGPAQKRHSSPDGNARGCPAGRCRCRRLRAPPCKTHRPSPAW